MEKKMNKFLNSTENTITINDTKLTIGTIGGEVFVGWYDEEREVHFLEDTNIFRLKDKIMHTFQLEEEIHLEKDLVINFLCVVLRLDYISDLHKTIRRDKIEEHLISMSQTKRDEEIKEEIEGYIDKIQYSTIT